MLRKKLFLAFSLLVIASMVLAACQPKEKIVTQIVKETSVVNQTSVVKETSVVTQQVVATQIVKQTQVQTQVVVETPTPPPARHGGWLDQIVYSVVNSDSAITQLNAGAIDVYGYPLGSASFPTIQKSGLSYATTLGTYYDIMYNPSVFTDTNTLNPFNDRKIREATNWLYDRDYINQEIYAGGSLPKYFTIQTNGPDYADLADVARGLESKYAYNLDQANTVITAEMKGLGATMGSDGKWQYKGKPVTLKFLIRIDGDGTRKPIGDYVSNQLEKVGFTVDRLYKKSSEAGPIWQRSNPKDGQWSMYTAGWINTGIELDAKGDFQQMYLNTSGQGIQPFLSNVADPAFQKLGDDLQNANFSGTDQRHQMMAQALQLSLQDSLQVFIIDTKSYAPYSPDLQISANLASGIETPPIAFYTARYKGKEGGTVKWGESDLFTEPWNPVAGDNWAWDQGAIGATDGSWYMDDPFTGLRWPLRAEKAELVAQTGLPIFKTLDWVTLSTADSIPVPADAWVRWDAKNQKFLTAAEYYTQTETAKIKSTIYYPADMFTTVKWHDGSPLSVGDFVMSMIVGTFDRANPDSPIYDDQAVPTYQSFLSSFKGVKIVSTDPLVIETYSDNYQPNAELDITGWWPNAGFGENAWDVLAVSNAVEAAGEGAYSPDKAQAKNIEQISYVGGPTLDAMSKELDTLIANNTIPYAATMSTYVTTDEAKTRYANLKTWFGAHGTYQIGTGPYFLDKAFLVEKSLVLKNNPDYPDPADRWSSFTTPKIAVVGITSPDQVTIGASATFTVSVTFNRAPYPQADISTVKFLLYDATNTVVATGTATAVADGVYTVNLTADITSKLTAGSCKLEVAVVSKVVAVPTFNSVQFVVGQ